MTRDFSYILISEFDKCICSGEGDYNHMNHETERGPIMMGMEKP